MRANGLIGMAVLAGLVLSLGSQGRTEAAGSRTRAESPHRALRAALYHLKEARQEVKDERLKRHRERIEKDLNVAIKEVERALKEGKIDARYEPAKGWDDKHKSFRHLRQALIELDEAKKEIREEKGEWARRKELREAIDDARSHVEDALKEIPVPELTPEEKELAALQGTWRMLRFEMGGKLLDDGRKRIWVIDGRRVALKEDGKTVFERKMTLDPTKNPQYLDLHDGPEHTDWAIYVRAGEYAIMCGSHPAEGTRRRPTEFATGTSAGGHWLAVWKIER